MTEVNIESAEINLEGVEDTTYFSDNENIPVEHVNFEFEQNSKLHGIHRKLTVFNDSHCYQSIKQKHQRKYKYRIDIAYLDPRPFRQRFRDWKWLYACIALVGLNIALVYAGWLDTSSINFLGLFTGITVVTIMSLLAFFYNSYDRVYFRTQYGKVKVMELTNRNPDKDSFRNFVTKLNMQIKKSKTAKNFTQNKFLTRELQELRRLKDETMVDDADYEAAKTRIFKHEAFKAAS